MLIFLYLLLTYAISWILEYYFPPAYDDLTMFVPGLVALTFCFFTKQNFTELFKKTKTQSLWIGFAIPMVASLLVVMISAILSLASYKFPSAAVTYHGGHFKAWTHFVFMGLPYLLIVGGFFALGEEIGWRGYLLPLLKKALPNFYYRALAMGLFWGIWHVPIYRSAGMPLLSIGIFIINVCLLSIILTWLFERENSIWPTLLAHATHNILQNNVVPAFLEVAPQVNERLLFGEEGILVTIAYTLIVLFLAGRGCFLQVRYKSGQNPLEMN